jgi:hypothetical protein
MLTNEKFEGRREQMLRELSSDLAHAVRCGEMTTTEANEWYSMKADQWSMQS